MLTHVHLFVTPWTVAHQALLSMEFFRQEYWSGSHFLVSLVAQVIKNLPAMPPGHRPNPGIKLLTLASPALVGRFFTNVPPGKPGV